MMNKSKLEENIKKAKKLVSNTESYAQISQDRLKRNLDLALSVDDKDNASSNLINTVNTLLASSMEPHNLVQKKSTYYNFFPVGEKFDDTEGAPIQAHGGGILKLKDSTGSPIYYWVGEDKSHDQGNFNGITLYFSKDLINWEYRKTILAPSLLKEGLFNCKIERPKIIYNSKNHKYIVWGHWEDESGYASSQICVAVSNNIEGDYEFLGHWRPGADKKHRNWRLLRTDPNNFDKGEFVWTNKSIHKTKFDFLENTNTWGLMSRDFTLYQDKDKVYFISSAGKNMNIFQLNDDYTDVKIGSNYTLFNNFREAPAMVKAGKYYFLITSSQTGWHPNQSSYSYATNIADPDSWVKPDNLNNHFIGNNTTFYSQSTDIINIGQDYLYIGDRWKPNNLGRSTYIWLPLKISKTEMKLNYNPKWRLDTHNNFIKCQKMQLISENKKVISNSQIDNLRIINDGQFTIDSNSLQKNGKPIKPPYSCVIDLESLFFVTRIDISFEYNPHGKTIPDYILETSINGQDWFQVAKKVNSDEVGFVSKELNKKAQFVRIRVIKAKETTVKSLVELQVYGKSL